MLSGRGLLDQCDWQQRVVSIVTRCRPAPPSVRCTLWPRRSTRTERREDSLWTGNSNMKTPTWPPPPCNSLTHTHTQCTGELYRCVSAVTWRRRSVVCFSVKDVTNKEVLGILVSYRVKVKLVVSRGGYDTHTHTHTADITSCLALFPVDVIVSFGLFFQTLLKHLWLSCTHI